MALPSNKYFVAFPPQILFRDKDTGSPLSAGAVYFYKDEDRTTLKPIYKQVRLPNNTYDFIEINNPVTLTSIGTFADDDGNDILIYLFPFSGTPEAPGDLELYYLRVYSSGNVFQFDREAYPPNVTSTIDDASFELSDNQITNPQFVEINFIVDPDTQVYEYAVTGTNTFEIAPGWNLITGGNGTVVIRRVPTSDLTDVPSNPPYALEIQTGGSISSVVLRQTLYASPALFYGGYINGSIVAKAINPATVPFTMSFNPSAGTTYTIFSDAAPTDNGLFTSLSNTIVTGEDGDTQNTDLAPGGYVDVDISWSALTTIQLTSIQLLLVTDEFVDLPFLQQATPRQIDHLYNYAYPIVPIGAIIDFGGFAVPEHYFLCDGNAYSRHNYQLLYNALTTTETVTLTDTVATFTVVSNTNYHIGMALEGEGIPASTTITNIVGTTITISNAATITGDSLVTFFAWGAGDGSTTFNVPNLEGHVTAGANGSVFSGVNGVGLSGGNVNHTLTANELPPHAHPVASGAASGAGASARLASGSGAATTGNNVTAHNPFSIVQPTKLVKKCIRYQ